MPAMVLVCVIAVFLFILNPLERAGASSTLQNGLTISPLRTELTIAPGTVQTGQLTIYNTTANDMDVAMNAELF
ncbi:hypothetical protein EPN95_01810, partial [Patescibacteria group bacterium]